MKSGSNLEKVLSAGHTAVTAELGPPMGCNAETVRKKMELLRGTADAFNVTDCQTAVVRMSSISTSIFLAQAGMEPVMQMTCRDRNRIAIQSDILGAAAHGIKNCLCIAGDHQSFGAKGKLKGHPGSKNVYDVDSIQLVGILRGLRDDARQQGGDPLDASVPLFIGAAWTPLGDPIEIRTIRLAKKVNAGADFIQTQAVYDIKRFSEAMQKARDRGLHERVAILAGIIVPKSGGMLAYMNKSVPGVVVPQELIDRMKAASDQRAEGIKIAVELIQQVLQIEGVRGVHIQAIEWEEAVREVVGGAGLLPRPTV
ncbi:MAG: methylenetetrahydrofolate reductase [Candidatus Abyssobacteria bacterium SURF_17]|jgi:methylenetetrahydrofolate reductase (NADPH)|uniref:Methylenetetrahydrofolate reductase n=1 Tax=Candidatus Abyssobacteria bacterium SURF_17 TaxID=2093361 RepID=A0A419EPY4_9BACT|nr:MAG: methylenetetrahydrofolate reductase [Candidatus Abyssubacteria bacterium SURF_17]